MAVLKYNSDNIELMNYMKMQRSCFKDKKLLFHIFKEDLRIGYNRAATIVEQLEQTGVLSEDKC